MTQILSMWLPLMFVVSMTPEFCYIDKIENCAGDSN